MSTEKLFTTTINKHPSKLKIFWCDNYFQLTILEANKAWTAEVSRNQLPEIAIQLDQDYESYNKSVYSYLFNPEDYTNISYTIQDNKFIIHKNIEGGFRVIFFHTPLEKKEYHICAQELLDELLSKNSFLENQISSLQELLQREIKERTGISEKYEELRKDVENREKELYSSFVLLLNEKKRRIQYLTELLDSSRINHLVTNQKNVDIKKEDDQCDVDLQLEDEIVKKRKCNFKKETISDSENDNSTKNSSNESDYDTDEGKNQKLKSPERSKDKPSSSKDDDVISLFKDYSETVVLPRKRRKNEDSVNIEEHNSFKFNVFDIKTQTIDETPAIKDEEESPVEFGTQDILDRM